MKRIGNGPKQEYYYDKYFNTLVPIYNAAPGETSGLTWWQHEQNARNRPIIVPPPMYYQPVFENKIKRIDQCHIHQNTTDDDTG